MKRILVLGDMHGKMPKISHKDFDMIFATGDFCEQDKIRSAAFKAMRIRWKDPGSKIMFWDILGKKKTIELIKNSIKSGRKILEKLDSFNVPVFIVPGNADWYPEDLGWDYLMHNNFEKMISGLKNIINLHERILTLDDFGIIGYGLSSYPEYPQYEDDLERKKDNLKLIKKEYDAQVLRLSNLFKKTKKLTIFLSHNVPFNIKLDVIINNESPRNGRHSGSLVSRKIIEKYNPFLCIAGHMHEHYGTIKLGKTFVFNAGFRKATLIEVGKGKVRFL